MGTNNYIWVWTYYIWGYKKFGFGCEYACFAIVQTKRATYFALSSHQGNIVAVLVCDLGTLKALLVAWNKKVLGRTVRHGGQLNLSLLWHQQELQRLNYFWIIHVNHFESRLIFFLLSLLLSKSKKQKKNQQFYRDFFCNEASSQLSYVW